MATTLDEAFEIERWTVPSIVELLRESQKLSENIYLAEIEVQNIDRLLKLLNECRRDNENYIKQLSVRPITGSISLVRFCLLIYPENNLNFPTCILTLKMNRF